VATAQRGPKDVSEKNGEGAVGKFPSIIKGQNFFIHIQFPQPFYTGAHGFFAALLDAKNLYGNMGSIWWMGTP
jgi:hypothetical protein